MRVKGFIVLTTPLNQSDTVRGDYGQKRFAKSSDDAVESTFLFHALRQSQSRLALLLAVFPLPSLLPILLSPYGFPLIDKKGRVLLPAPKDAHTLALDNRASFPLNRFDLYLDVIEFVTASAVQETLERPCAYL
jgi:hypothetical protein